MNKRRTPTHRHGRRPGRPRTGIESKLHDLDQKLDYLIKNLRRLNGRQYPTHQELHELD